MLGLIGFKKFSLLEITPILSLLFIQVIKKGETQWGFAFYI
jgi:hypothetical protein